VNTRGQSTYFLKPRYFKTTTTTISGVTQRNTVRHHRYLLGYFQFFLHLLASFSELLLPFHHTDIVSRTPDAPHTIVAMADEFSEDDVLSHLAHRPRYILSRVIKLAESAKPAMPKIQRTSQSSIGCLDNLPIELLHTTFMHLDLRTLTFLSRVSLRGKDIVESLPAYRDLLSSAGHVFQVLSRTKVIRVHSAAVLYAALCVDRCASCGNYGAFLFLLSAERCCFACLSINQSLCMIPLALARASFDLSTQESKNTTDHTKYSWGIHYQKYSF
jgi:hypothetical protein